MRCLCLWQREKETLQSHPSFELELKHPLMSGSKLNYFIHWAGKGNLIPPAHTQPYQVSPSTYKDAPFASLTPRMYLLPGHTIYQARHAPSFVGSGTGAGIYRLSRALNTINIFLLLYTNPKSFSIWNRARCNMASSSDGLQVCVQPCRQHRQKLRPGSGVGKMYVLLSL